MAKPNTIAGYDGEVTAACERVLVTLMRGLGPYAESVFLIGGLTPRYLVKERPPEVPPHAGTADVDVVIDGSILADTKAYRTLEENLKRMGFERGTNDKGVKVSWRWQAEVESGETIILEFLVDAPPETGGKVQEVEGAGGISAMGIPHAGIVFDHHDQVSVTAELLGGEGEVTETIRYADAVSFVCLKAFAFKERAERKDAHDLVYCLEHVAGGLDDLVTSFKAAKEGKHGEAVSLALEILRKHFCDGEDSEGYRKDGPVKAARFEEDDRREDDADRERRILRQRQVAEIAGRFIAALGA
jgi:hypothetical protein